MKLGLALEWASKELRLPMQKILLAEKLGFDSVWTAETYGTDAMMPLAFIAAQTRRIRLGTSVAQVAGRPPAMAAMMTATLDALAGEGRAILGLGLSGPQIVEGWYGRPWGDPHQTLRDYVSIVRKVLRREGPVQHDGTMIRLPYDGENSSGMGKALKMILHGNPEIPVWLGTGSQRNVELTAELADGWLPFGFWPGSLEQYKPWLATGFERAGGGKSLDNFEIQANCMVDLNEDVQGALDALKPFYAFYVGGMGHPRLNFHKELMKRRGYGEAAERIQELFQAGRREEATRAVPDQYVDDGALVGPEARIRERFAAWQDSGATGMTLHGADEKAMRLFARMNF